MSNKNKSYLLVQACSARKKEVSRPIPALELYDGYFYRIIKNSELSSNTDPVIDIRIISAEYGLLRPEDVIETYERKMDSQRAVQLQSSVVNSLIQEVANHDFDEVVINLGKVYQQAISGLPEAVSVPVRTIEGSGIGVKGHILKQFLNGDTSALRAVA